MAFNTDFGIDFNQIALFIEEKGFSGHPLIFTAVHFLGFQGSIFFRTSFSGSERREKGI